MRQHKIHRNSIRNPGQSRLGSVRFRYVRFFKNRDSSPRKHAACLSVSFCPDLVEGGLWADPMMVDAAEKTTRQELNFLGVYLHTI